MKMSIIVPAYNEEKLLAGSLQAIQEALGAFHDRGWVTELIVCDNNSTDRTADIARAQGAKVVFEPINQIARARNRGAAAASGDWLIFVDADSCPSRALFADVAEQIASGKCLAGGATVALDEADRFTRAALGLWNVISRSQRYMAGSFIFCEAEVFHKIGGFNLHLFVSEELDLSKRLKRVARQTGRRIIILHRHPLVTSGRKVSLYGHRAHARFILRSVLRCGGNWKSRDECAIWYDGKR